MSSRHRIRQLVAATAVAVLGIGLVGLAAATSAAVAAAPPTVNYVTASSGPGAGGNVVTVIGTGFGSASTVAFGSIKATHVAVQSSSRLTVTAPRHQLGSFYVHVTTTRGTSAAATGNKYHYVEVPGALPLGASQPASTANITDMSCPWSSYCAAVDSAGNVVTYDGTSWVTTRQIDSFAHLTSISCLSPAWCAAVDSSGHAMQAANGGWSAPVQIDTHPLTSVSCLSDSICFAVDSAGFVVGFSNGHWHTPRQLLATGRLNSVSCAPEKLFCYAVGYGTDADGGPKGGEAVRYVSGWQAAHTIAPGTKLEAVSCTSPTFCMAGSFEQGVKIYTGAVWSTYAVPDYNIGEIDGPRISHISCVSAQFCNVTDWDGDRNTDVVLNGAAVGHPGGNLPGSPTNLPTSCWAANKCLVAEGMNTYTVG
jgi:hypothetical protein